MYMSVCLCVVVLLAVARNTGRGLRCWHIPNQLMYDLGCYQFVGGSLYEHWMQPPGTVSKSWIQQSASASAHLALWLASWLLRRRRLRRCICRAVVAVFETVVGASSHVGYSRVTLSGRPDRLATLSIQRAIMICMLQTLQRLI